MGARRFRSLDPHIPSFAEFPKEVLRVLHTGTAPGLGVYRNVDSVTFAETHGKPTILIVDDEPSVGDALQLVLESEGYEVVLATNGHDGIDQARRRRFVFSVVDLFLTDISGFQVITDIRSLQPDMPIVLITAHGSPSVFAEAVKLGAVGALAKPFPPAEILKLIDAHVVRPRTDTP